MSGRTAADPGIAGVAVTVNGRAIAPEALEAIITLDIDTRLRVPDRLTLRLRDDELAFVDGGDFTVGAPIKIALASDEEASDSTDVFDGQITTLAPEFDGGVTSLGVLALDRGCLLQRETRSATYQTSSYGDIASQLATSAGLSAGTVESGLTLPFVQQSNETDWDFLWRLAAEVDYEVKVTGQRLHFRPAGSTAAGDAVELALGEDLRQFFPRVSAVGQLASVTVRGWNPTTAEAIVATASPGRTQSRPGITRASLGAQGKDVVADHPVVDQAHADKIAGSLASRNANGYVEGEGRADATPKLLAGGLVNLTGLGQRFSGTYAVSGVRHVLRVASGIETRFTIAGRADRSLLGLTATGASARNGWQRRIVVGVVTNNNDPDQLGRIRVKHPELGDNHEGWWARVVVPGAGTGRGLLTLPLVGDEVLVAFEHGDERHPYVLGSVYNGTAKPGELVTTDGSFSLGSDQKLTVTAKDAMKLTAKGPATLTTKPAGDAPGAIDVTSAAGLTLEADQATTVKAGTSATFEAGTTATLTGKTSMKLDGGGTLELAANGQVTIKGAMVSVEATGVLKLSGATVMLG